MRKRTLPAATALAVLFGSAALTMGSASPAAASAELPVTSVGDIVVDAVHQRVFVSNPLGGQIVATDYAGRTVKTVPSLPGVRGLELSPDSGTLYAAVPGADAIVAVSTATLTEVKRYPTGGGTDPQYPAWAGGKLWFGYGTADQGDIGSLDLSAASPVITLHQDPNHPWSAAPVLATHPGAPHTLVAGVKDVSPFSLAVYDVSSGTATRTASGPNAVDSVGGNLRDLALGADGSQIVTAGESPFHHQAFRTSDLALDGIYPSTYWPTAVEIAPDGTIAAGVDNSSAPVVYLYEPHATTPVRTHTFSDVNGFGNGRVVPGGLAWTPDESRLFVITTDEDGSFTLRVLTDPTRAATAVSVDAPATATRAKELSVTGKVSSDLAFPAGTTVAVTRTDLESPAGKALVDVPVTADGTYSFKDTPPAGGTVKYTVSYAGDADHTTSSASGTVAVSRATPSLTLNKNGNVYAYGADVTFTAHLGTTYKNRAIEIWADPYGSDKPNKLVKSGTVNSSGNLSVTLDLTRDTKLTAKFAGDARYKPVTATSSIHTKVRISSSISGYYKTQSAWNHTYHYIRQSKDPALKTTMTYYPGREQLLQLQAYYQGSWQDAGARYFPLSTSGVSAVTLTGTPSTNVRFRFRSEYHDRNGDNVNTTTYGAWKYFIFTS
ncbi:hypothetical protein [Streptomyces neyagawaensis]|uniref:hypothetical protein n=1 Tax=Streptomyces neyagawaensis TaxID=42238 RepID=UPI0006E3682F|nr:hypothetical protein [Streptomyces neyagawaensis]MCL6734669.1 Ig-like domain repeat protein [Streptomyces neyagawaensis]MDE1682168.1 Ig-like domain repeat protein [Streptomyces neyagawaensis]